MFGVSRVTVRRALGTLEKESRVYRHQGLGSFVAPAKLPQGLVRLTDFTQDMQQAGLKAFSQLIGIDRVEAVGPISRALEVERGDTVFRIDRLRLGDGKEVAFDRTWLPPFYAQLLDGRDLATTTIYSILEDHYDIPVIRGRYRIESAAAGIDEATRLKIEVGSPVLRIERTSYTVGEKPVYFQRRYYRADRVAFELELARQPDHVSPPGAHSKGMPLREFVPVFKK